MHSCSIKQNVVQLADKHGRREINDQSQAALISQVSRDYDPKYDSLVYDNVHNAKAKVHDCVVLDLWELFEKEQSLSQTLVVLAEHVVSHNNKQVPQNYVQWHVGWVKGLFGSLPSHDKQ